MSGVWFALLTMASGLVYGQSISNSSLPLPLEKAPELGPEYKLIRPMIGTWQVQQLIWKKAGTKPVSSPPFRVRRQLIGHFLQEIMDAKPGTSIAPFTRMSYINFNNANRRWEYVVLDTRWPVVMFETSKDETVTNNNQLSFYLDSFIMPPMMSKEHAGEQVRQRRTLSFVSPNQQVVRQYLTLPAGKEYLAFEYTYTRTGAVPVANR